MNWWMVAVELVVLIVGGIFVAIFFEPKKRKTDGELILDLLGDGAPLQLNLHLSLDEIQCREKILLGVQVQNAIEMYSATMTSPEAEFYVKKD